MFEAIRQDNMQPAISWLFYLNIEDLKQIVLKSQSFFKSNPYFKEPYKIAEEIYVDVNGLRRPLKLEVKDSIIDESIVFIENDRLRLMLSKPENFNHYLERMNNPDLFQLEAAEIIKGHTDKLWLIEAYSEALAFIKLLERDDELLAAALRSLESPVIYGGDDLLMLRSIFFNQLLDEGYKYGHQIFHSFLLLKFIEKYFKQRELKKLPGEMIFVLNELNKALSLL